MAEIKGVKTRWWVIGGIGAAGVVWWAYKRQQASAASTTTTQDPNIDPNTGQPYSSEYAGSGSSAVGVTPSLYGYIDQFGNLITSGTSNTTVTAPSTNAAWAQQAESYLSSSAGYDALTVAAALGKALGGLNLSNDEFNIVQTAVGFEGSPPQGWPNGAPHVAPPDGQVSNGAIATRKDSASNPMPVVIVASETGWHQVAQDHYTFSVDIAQVGDSLAHYNGKSGLSNPHGLPVVLPAKLMPL